MCPYYQVRGRQEGGRPQRQSVAAAKIPHTRRTLMLRTSLDTVVDARLTRGGVPEKLRYSQPMPRPAEP